jgi:hypothetical protein
VIPFIALGALLATAGTVVAWLPRVGPSRDVGALAAVTGAALLGAVAAVPDTPVAHGDDLALLLPVALAVVAVLGGGPVTAGVLRLADRESAGKVEQAAAVLRGGAWIGVFERAAIFATLVAGWPEGIAVVLALKGLGRYSELRGDVVADAGPGSAPHGGVAERFIIGTFCSALWAAGGAGVLVGLLP